MWSVTRTFFLFIALFCTSMPALLQAKPNNEKLAATLQHYEGLYKKFQYINADSVVRYAEQGLQYFTQQDYAPGRARMLAILGNKKVDQGNMQEGRTLLNEALHIYEANGNEKGIAHAINSLGVLEGRNGNYKVAMEHFLKALILYEKKKDTVGLVSTYTKMGVVYEHTEQLERASSFYDKALDLATRHQMWDDIVTLNNNKGIIYCKQDSLDTAIPYFEKAIALSKAKNVPQTSILPLTNLGTIYAMRNQDEIALEYYNQAFALTSVNRMEDRVRIGVSIAKLQAQKDPEVALQLLSQQLVEAQQKGYKTLQIEILNAMSGIYKKAGQFEKALAVNEQQEAMGDSLFEIEKLKEIANLQAVYDLDKSNKELHVANRENQWHKRMQIGATIVAFILGFFLSVLYVFYRKRNKLLKQIQIHEAELAKANDDKDRIFSIIGHDLKGPIGNIPIVLHLLKREDTTPEEREYFLDSTIESATAATDVLDKLLNWGKSQIKGISKVKETFNPHSLAGANIRLLQHDIEGKQLRVRNGISDAIWGMADVDSVSFIIRNLLANAIKFSYANTTIDITAAEYPHEGYLTISVKDQGIGMTEEQCAKIFELSNISKDGTAKEKGNSIGLILCKEFAVQNGGRIWVESEPGEGATFHFTVPMVGSRKVELV